jgi:hypothetical protein
MKSTLAVLTTCAVAGLVLVTSLNLVASPRGAQKQLGKARSNTPAANQALAEALTGPDGEFAALAFYESVQQKFGEVSPYAMVIRAEGRHAEALKRHFAMRGLALPEPPQLNALPLPDTLQGVAELAAAAEERNVAMYNRLIAQVQDQPDLLNVFTQLQRASREHHLPAMRLAAANGGKLPAGTSACGSCQGCGNQSCGAAQGCSICPRGNGGQYGCGGTCAAAGPAAGKTAASDRAETGRGNCRRFHGACNF